MILVSMDLSIPRSRNLSVLNFFRTGLDIFIRNDKVQFSLHLHTRATFRLFQIINDSLRALESIK